MRRRKGIKWDYNGDGRFPTERVKGEDKRYWKRWQRRVEKLLERSTDAWEEEIDLLYRKGSDE